MVKYTLHSNLDSDLYKFFYDYAAIVELDYQKYHIMIPSITYHSNQGIIDELIKKGRGQEGLFWKAIKNYGVVEYDGKKDFFKNGKRVNDDTEQLKIHFPIPQKENKMKNENDKLDEQVIITEDLKTWLKNFKDNLMVLLSKGIDQAKTWVKKNWEQIKGYGYDWISAMQNVIKMIAEPQSSELMSVIPVVESKEIKVDIRKLFEVGKIRDALIESHLIPLGGYRGIDKEISVEYNPDIDTVKETYEHGEGLITTETKFAQDILKDIESSYPKSIMDNLINERTKAGFVESKVEEKKETDPSLKPSKEFVKDMMPKLKKQYPKKSEKDLGKILGGIWYKKMTPAQRKKSREKVGKTYGPAPKD